MGSHRLTLVLVLAALAACGSEGGSEIDFADLRIERITPDRAVLRFTTSIATACEAEYGTAEDALDGRATDPDMEEGETAIDHEVALEDLAPATGYHVRAHATAADGTEAYSELVSFETLDGADPSAGLRNVALGSAGAAVLDRSSNYAGGADTSGFGIAKAFDDSMATEWSSNSDGDGAFVVIGLAAEETLTKVGYRSRKMADGTSIVEAFELTIGGELYGPFPTPDPDQRYVFALDPPPTATEVRFDAVTTTGGNTGAKEIQLFAP